MERFDNPQANRVDLYDEHAYGYHRPPGEIEGPVYIHGPGYRKKVKPRKLGGFYVKNEMPVPTHWSDKKGLHPFVSPVEVRDGGGFSGVIRYPETNEIWYPSLTHIISRGSPRSKYLELWMQQVGMNAPLILKEKGDFGSAVHNLIEKFLLAVKDARESDSNELPLFQAASYDPEGNLLSEIPTEIWDHFLRFVRFLFLVKDYIVIHAVEARYIDPVNKFGFTLDLDCTLFGLRTLIDHKTSTSIHDSHLMQLCATKDSLEMLYGRKYDKICVFWTRANTRTEKIDSKKFIFQGKGWQLKDMTDRYQHGSIFFKAVKQVWEIDNQDWKPKHKTLPFSINPKNFK